MRAIISDLHFQDIRTVRKGITADHNVSIAMFQRLLFRLLEMLQKNGENGLELILNGDTFDFWRTDLWFIDQVRPYEDIEPNGEVSIEVEKRLLDIYGRIADSEGEVAKILKLFKSVSTTGEFSYRKRDYKFDTPVTLTLIPGNHDRVLNYCTSLRRRVREDLGLKGDDLFPQQIIDHEIGLALRHGHEYDFFNCEYNFDPIGDHFEPTPDRYGYWTIGDLITIDIVQRLPWQFFSNWEQNPYGLREEAMSRLYRRMLDFDDVRPNGDILEFVMDAISRMDEADREPARRAVHRTLRDIGQALGDSRHVHRWLERYDWKDHLDKIDVAELLAGPVLKNLTKMPLDWIDKLIHKVRPGQVDRTCWEILARDPAWNDPLVRYVCHGHYHDSWNEYIEAAVEEEVTARQRVTICTGTWRKLIRKCRLRGFYKSETMNYAVFPSAKELGAKGVHFNLWCGQRKTDGGPNLAISGYLTVQKLRIWDDEDWAGAGELTFTIEAPGVSVSRGEYRFESGKEYDVHWPVPIRFEQDETNVAVTIRGVDSDQVTYNSLGSLTITLDMDNLPEAGQLQDARAEDFSVSWIWEPSDTLNGTV